MIEFMVIANPRSATTWAANWLTTDTTLCMHDPLFTKKVGELDSIESSKALGISCTAIQKYREYLSTHSARKVIVHRDDCVESLDRIGLFGFRPPDLSAINGMHVYWHDLFNKPKEIYEFLLQKEFDAERHAELVQMNIQPKLDVIKIDHKATRAFIMEMASLC